VAFTQPDGWASDSEPQRIRPNLGRQYLDPENHKQTDEHHQGAPTWQREISWLAPSNRD
jgi:hypothetical protein